MYAYSTCVTQDPGDFLSHTPETAGLQREQSVLCICHKANPKKTCYPSMEASCLYLEQEIQIPDKPITHIDCP